MKKIYSTITNREKLARAMIEDWDERQLFRYAKFNLIDELSELSEKQFSYQFKKFFQLEEYQSKDFINYNKKTDQL